MRLYEEFKEYETLWEAHEQDQVDEILRGYDDFEFEYDGFDDDNYEDHYSYDFGHYTTSKLTHYDSFTYKVDAISLFDFMRDDFLPDNADNISDDKLEDTFKKLNTATDDTYAALNIAKEKNTPEEIKAATAAYNTAMDALELFIANNLGTFVDMFYSELLDCYEDEARDWARDNW